MDRIINKTVNHKKLGKGSIIILHNGTKYTADTLENILTGIREKGYKLVPVSQLIYTGEYKVDKTGRQSEK